MSTVLSNQVQKRQNQVVLISSIYIALYVFGISVTDLNSIGLKFDTPPAKLIPAGLMVVICYLYIRYFLEVFSSVKYRQVLQKEQEDLRELNASIRVVDVMHSLAKSDGEPYPTLQKSNQIPCIDPTLEYSTKYPDIDADLINFWRQIFQKVRENDLKTAQKFVAENAKWLLAETTRAKKLLIWRKIKLRFSLSILLAIIFFDILLPTVLLIVSLYIHIYEPEFLIYSN